MRTSILKVISCFGIHFGIDIGAITIAGYATI
ncbi:hypothetical protein H4W00_001141 [Psychrobacter sp. PL19]